jgi:dTDP-glucose pyrophosphorylase
VDLELFLVTENMTVFDAINHFDKNIDYKILFVCDDGRLKAAITDGDIRRFVQKGGSPSDNISSIANYKPLFLYENDQEKANDVFKNSKIHCLPIVDSNMKIKTVVFRNELRITSEKLDIPVVIMAGGLGTRLYPYTHILPKPLIPINNLPIIEHIIKRFCAFGCKDFYLVLNHKKNMIKSYMNDIEKDYNVYYIDEDKQLGTGGGLFYLKDILKSTFFVTNCDILLDFDYTSIYNYHKKNNNIASMVGAVKNVTIPYGIINSEENGHVLSLSEKPCYPVIINTGVYILESRVLDVIPPDTFIHITDILTNLIQAGENVGVFPISEKSFLDMGEIESMKEMIKELGD